LCETYFSFDGQINLVVVVVAVVVVVIVVVEPLFMLRIRE